MFDKRYQVDRTFFTVKNFSIHVEAASRITLRTDMHVSIMMVTAVTSLRIHDPTNFEAVKSQ
jgi:hypothetical protein